MKYRAEIDGLRAIAVTSILIFHYFPDSFPLGYLGVDLFFVISGFLISSYIIREKRAGLFSYQSFYYRRAKRILPATLALLICTTITACIFLTAPDLIRYAASMLATLTFTANMYFWQDGGYFGTTDELKPLLHMWSLGVEEQFYLFFPVTLAFLMKFFKRTKPLLAIIIIIILLSFSANVFLLRTNGANPAFFLLPTRIWQFGIGVIAAIYYLDFPSQHKSSHLYLIAITLILGFLYVPSELPAGLIVTVTAGYFLAKKYVETPVLYQFFSNWIIRKIGLISFSLYLWHWPIIVFIKYYTIDSLSFIHLAVGVLATVILALLSYTFIEEPFRKKQQRHPVLIFTGSLAIVLSVLSGVILFLNGFPERDRKIITSIAEVTQTNYKCSKTDFFSYGGSRACYINKEQEKPYDLALIGNSHAQMYVPVFQHLLGKDKRKGLLIPFNTCLPTIDINVSEDCLRLANQNFKAYMADQNIKTVVFSTTWYADTWVNSDGVIQIDKSRMKFAHSLLDLISKVQISGRNVYLVGPIEIPNYDLPSVLSRKIKFTQFSTEEALDALKVSRHQFDEKYNQSIHFLQENLGERLILPSKLLCDDVYCYYGREEEIYFADREHLGLIGALKTENLFVLALGAK